MKIATVRIKFPTTTIAEIIRDNKDGERARYFAEILSEVYSEPLTESDIEFSGTNVLDVIQAVDPNLANSHYGEALLGTAIHAGTASDSELYQILAEIMQAKES